MRKFTRFTRTIGGDGETLDLTYYGINTTSGIRYFISACKGDEHWVFHVGQDETGGWGIIGDAPAWAGEVEKEIFDGIR
jgi:hypothetical protein